MSVFPLQHEYLHMQAVRCVLMKILEQLNALFGI